MSNDTIQAIRIDGTIQAIGRVAHAARTIEDIDETIAHLRYIATLARTCVYELEALKADREELTS